MCVCFKTKMLLRIVLAPDDIRKMAIDVLPEDLKLSMMFKFNLDWSLFCNMNMFCKITGRSCML